MFHHKDNIIINKFGPKYRKKTNKFFPNDNKSIKPDQNKLVTQNVVLS